MKKKRKFKGIKMAPTAGKHAGAKTAQKPSLPILSNRPFKFNNLSPRKPDLRSLARHAADAYAAAVIDFFDEVSGRG